MEESIMFFLFGLCGVLHLIILYERDGQWMHWLILLVPLVLLFFLGLPQGDAWLDQEANETFECVLKALPWLVVFASGFHLLPVFWWKLRNLW